MKKISFNFAVKAAVCSAVLLAAVICTAAAQQITRFGVVDTARVYTTYFRDTAAVRNYEAKKTEFQTEINKMTDELKRLQQRKIEYQQKKDTVSEMKISAEISQKTDFLTEYSRAKNVELDSIKRNLETSDEFYSKLYDVIGNVAESEGYSLILSLQQANGVLWYSNAVDITDKVISQLNTRL